MIERPAAFGDSPRDVASMSKAARHAPVETLNPAVVWIAGDDAESDLGAFNQGESIGGRLLLDVPQPSPLPRVLIPHRDLPGRPGPPRRPTNARGLTAAALALGLGAVTAIAVFISWAPWPVGVGLAIVCATVFCIGLQRLPN